MHDRQYGKAVQLAIDLGLGSMGKQLDVATIGEGVPYLAAAAQAFGHRVVAFTSSDDHVEDATAILGVEHTPITCFSLDGRDPLDSRYWFDLIVCMGSSGILSHSTFRRMARCVWALMRSIRIPTGRVVCAFDPQWAGGRWRLVSRWRRHLRRVQIRAIDGRIEFIPRGLP